MDLYMEILRAITLTIFVLWIIGGGVITLFLAYKVFFTDADDDTV